LNGAGRAELFIFILRADHSVEKWLCKSEAVTKVTKMGGKMPPL